MMTRNCIVLFFTALFFSFEAGAAIKLPSIFGDNMVLQQQSSVPLWGTGAPGSAVKVTTSWNHRTYRVTCDPKGAFQLQVTTPSAGGPYAITFDDGSLLTVKNVLIGEVWVCSGQSNMEISLKGYGNQPVANSNNLLMHAGDTGLRLFHVQRAVSNTPESDCTGAWETATPESASTFSAVGFQFAQILRGVLKVPVGIIEASWGGTPIEAWMDRQSLETFPNVKVPTGDSVKADRLRPTCLYNGMIAPIAGYGIKGFIWYQGETNAGRPAGYDHLMVSMVSSWRKHWNRDTLPFYYVQIAPWKYKTLRDSVPFLREAQDRAEAEIPRSGMVVTIDAGNEFTIHPPDKTVVSERLAYWALGDTYGHSAIAYRSPRFNTLKVNGPVATVTFTQTPHGLTSWNRPIQGFEVAGADHVFHPADAKIHGNAVQVQSRDVPVPVAVRYAFTDWVTGNLYNTEGLPVAPFRTDR